MTLEGLEGAGKTYLARRLAALLGDSCVLLSEVTDQDGATLAGRVIDALSREGDLFLRTGHPVAETFALLALKVRERERVRTSTAAAGASLVLEDRGLDTVAVYQAPILDPDALPERMFDLALRIRGAVTRWLPEPDLTILLTDDADECAKRFSERIGRAVRADERVLMAHADRLYGRFAAQERRFAVVDRSGLTTEQVLVELHRLCTDLVTRSRGAA